MMRVSWTLMALALAGGVAEAQAASRSTSTPNPPAAPAPPATPAAPAATLDKPPKLTHFVQAPPPASLAERGQVDVVLTIDVDERGQVAKVAVAQSGGPEYDEAALAAVRQFVFTPGEAGGHAVPVRVTYRYRFLYQPAPPPEPAPAGDSAPGATPPAPTVPAVPLSGRVLRKGDRTPVGGVDVLADDGKEPIATADGDGRFTIELPAGEHVIRLRSSNIVPADQRVTLNAGKRLEVTYYAAVRERYTSIVRAQRAVVETVEQTLSGEEIRRIPGTQGDALKAVQNLAGVARAPFGGGQLVVWGSSPEDTRTYVDGVYIPTLYHFGGLRSTVNSEMVDSLQFMPGGYGVDHGRGLGGVVEIETRAPRSDGYHGFAQIDLIDGSLSIEGPITKNLSFAVGLRRSWIDVFLPIFTSNDFQLSPVYYDYQAKLRWRASPRDDLDVFIFGSDDAVRLVAKRPDPTLSAQFDSHTFYHRILARWTHRFANRMTLTVTPSIGYDVPFSFKANVGNTDVGVDVRTFEYNLRSTLRLPLTRWLRFDAGLDLEGNRWSLSLNVPANGRPREGDSRGNSFSGLTRDALTLDQIAIAPYVALPISLFGNRLQVTPSFRLDMYDLRGYQNSPQAFNHFFVAPEPRVSLRWQINKWAAIKAAVGWYHQVPDPSSYLANFGNTALKPEEAWHYVLGAEFRPTSTLSVEVEGFYKDMSQLVVRGGNQPGDPALTNHGLGRVYGGELMVRQQLWKNFFGWISYTVSRAERKNPDEPDPANRGWRVFQFDQTHILTIIASYKLPRGYQVGLRFRYVTGNPYTPALLGQATYDVNDDMYVRRNGPIYSARLSSFNQLDLRFDKKWTFQKWALSIYLDIQNLYNSTSPEGYAFNYNYTKQQPVSGLPFLPVFGIRGDF